MGISRRKFIKAGAAGLGALTTKGFADPHSLSAPDDFSRVAFGSCLRDSTGTAALDQIVKAAPHAFVWLGDNIYGDTADMDILRAKYKALGDNEAFKRLKAVCPMLATWDDHDYGLDNAGQEYVRKKESQQIFLDFWGATALDPRRSREGIYHSRVFGEGVRTIQFILLDGRYFRSTKKDPNATMLGAAQWQWLEDQFKIPATLRVLCCGIQVVADEHRFEGWCEFPKERDRLYRLIKDSKTQGVVFTSGDQHWAELSRADDVLGYPAYDLTASSLDQTWPLPVNGKRLGPGTPNPNFGVIEVDWNHADPLIRFRIQSVSDGKAILEQAVPLSTLYPWCPVGISEPK